MSLAAKLAEVMAAVERVPKRGINDFHKYAYATEADIVAVVRKELASRHVILIPAILNSDRVAVGEKGEFLTSLGMEFTFIDGESLERETFPWLGVGSDKGDKGAYKAMTGGEKYFLLKTFLIPTGDDPELDASLPDIQLREPAAPPPTMNSKPTAPTPTPPAAARVAPSRFPTTKPRAGSAVSIPEPPPYTDADAPMLRR
jgi:hypothetical protein